MALTVGELNAFLGIDTRQFDAGLSGAEQDLKTTGRQMTADTERAAVQAGRALADGFTDGADRAVRGADGRLRDARGRFVRAGRQAGDAFGDGLADRAEDGGDQAAQDAAGGLEAGKGKFAGAGAMVGAAAGAAAGAALMAGLTEALDQSRITARLSAQLGATPAEAEKYGDLAGDLYANAVVDDFQGAADTIRGVMGAGLLPPDATNRQIEEVSTKVADLANVFEFDLGETAVGVGQLMKAGMAKDADEALDIIAAGLRGTDARAEDAMETLTEYGSIFEGVGLDGRDAMGLIRQGLAAGVKDTDKIADAVKEFSLKAVEDSESVQDAFKTLGLDGKAMGEDIGAGGDRARDALDKVLDELRKMPESAERARVIQELFGGPGEDLGADIFALDVDKAAKALGDMEGAAEDLGDTLRNNAGARVEQLRRQLTQGFVEGLGSAITGLEDLGGRLKEFWDEAGEGADGFPDQVLNALQTLGEKAWEKVRELGPKLIDAVVEAGEEFGTYVMENPEEVLKIAALGAAFVAAIAALPIVVGAALISTATALIWTFVAGMISALIEKLPEWWDSFTGWISEKADEAGLAFDVLGQEIADWFGGLWDDYIGDPVARVWSDWTSSVETLPSRTTAALSGLGWLLYRKAAAAWQDFKDAAVRKGVEIVWWARRLPGRITGAIGGLGWLLYSKGRDLVSGLWSGIRSMGGWLWNTLYSWAKSSIPGPIARALGIASPSKVMRDQIGRWIPAGVVDGIRDGQGAVDEAMASLVNPDRVPAVGGRLDIGAGAAGGGAAGGDGRPLVLRVEIGGRAFGELVVDTALHEVRVNPGVKSELRAQLVS
ncbi:phage tail tape measure protein [Streptomyces mangrovi]|uniref:phage tail tape measure protein n=1 Tax=Streptomyces mangrovi TaxID=1206892 RepID=UPI00399D28E1